MIEKTILRFLNERMSVSVVGEIPSPPEREYVLVVKVGETEKDFLYTSKISILATGRSMLRAAGISETVKTEMPDLIELDEVTKVKLVDEGNVTDPLSKRHRYQTVYEVTHY